MSDDADLMERLVDAAGADESPVDREEHAGLVAKVVERVRGARDLTDDLLEQTRMRRSRVDTE
jgi:hypothetical protein